MKSGVLFLFVNLCVPTAGILQAAINPENSKTYYNAADWYAIRNGGEPTITSASESVTIGNLKYDGMFFCYFNPVALDSGEYLQISGKIKLGSTYSGTGGNTVIGIFDSGDYTQEKLNKKLRENSLGNAYNSKSSELGASAVTGSMAGFLSSVKLSFNRNNPGGNSSCLATNSGGSRAANYGTEFPAPEAGTNYAFLLKILRTEAETYSVTFSLGGGNETVGSLQNEAFGNPSVLAFKLPVGTGGAVTISELAFKTTGTVIPEPSLFGCGAGVMSLAAFCLRRSRKKRRAD